MTLNGSVRPDVQDVLGKLKDFQRETVHYVFRRLYTDPDRVSRFLIADEVGLGKTLVARGIIAKAVEHLWDTVPRIDVIYICSNLDIAQQNIARLNITADRQFQFASRATLLPITLEELKGNKLNFVSLTPGTSLNLRSQTGWKRERAVLFALLRDHWAVPEGTLKNVLRGRVRKDLWKSYLNGFKRDDEAQLDEELRHAFYKELDRTPALRAQYEAVAELIGPHRKHLSDEMRRARNDLIGSLRRLLARSSLSALEPDLVILDEFQRFKYLLDKESDIAPLARELFDFPDAKVLLLSATPYKMYTLQGETEDDHYEDFYHTVEFLLRHQPDALVGLDREVERYGRAMIRLGDSGQAELQESKTIIENILRRVVVRTERLAASADRNGMLSETLFAQDQIRPADLEGFVHLDRIATALDAGDQVEYWKSAAYPLNMMDRYKLKSKFTDALEDPEKHQLTALLQRAQGHLLDWDTIQSYQAVDPGNARLRAFWHESIETGNWQLLWMPPALPYYQPDGPFRDVNPGGCTKSLIFSGWRVVPKTISVLLSYEAERRMLEASTRDFAYSELTKKRRPLLTFTLSRERLTGMRVFCLTYPCLALAKAVDPLLLARNLSDDSLASQREVIAAAKAKIGELLSQAESSLSFELGGRVDDDWYEGALALLDQHRYHHEVEEWLSTEDGKLAWARMLDTTSDKEELEEGETLRYAEHVEVFIHIFQNPERLGVQPENLVDVLTHMALGSPAIVALRAMLRVAQPQSDDQWPPFLAAAARIGLAFRTLFNQPDAIAFLQSRYLEGAYWEKALRYCLDGNLQAVMDEYIHVLHESLGLVGHDPADSATKLSENIQRALSLRAPTLRFDEVVWSSPQQPTIDRHGIRCRYALRFGDEQSADYEGRTRDVDVRIAFNSPFRPFVLATTSIGQEGLDFHQYCHRVVHWNLPSNPVDLEQREGRVHRYKGHVIRRNLALNYGLAAVGEAEVLDDPWELLFRRAIEDRPDGANDLIPFWIYEASENAAGGTTFKIERKVPVLPLSREIGRIEQLKRSLVAYRSVIGQPRQQELLEFLSARLGEQELQELVDSVAIDLSPPRAETNA